MLGYLKKVARIDTCRGQESVRTVSNPHHHQQLVPEVRLLSPSTASSPVTMTRTSASGSSRLFLSNTSLSKSCLDDNEESEVSLAEEEDNSHVMESSKRRRRRHLLPTSFLNLLPPGTPRSGRSSSSSGFKSNQSRPTSVSDDGRHLDQQMKRHNSDHMSKKNAHHANDGRQHGRKSTWQSSRATTPTTFCPTIASALWRPLWPPGENRAHQLDGSL